MFQHQGIWFPDGETHLVDWMNRAGEMVDGKGTYQIKKLRQALSYVSSFRQAVDVGAHVGLWSMHLAKRFRLVHAFEPVEDHRACFFRNVMENVPDATNCVTLTSCALGEDWGRVSMKRHSVSSGDTVVVPGGDVLLRPLDSFDLVDIDFMKIDVEGYEEKVIEGAKETILRSHPVIIVEQKPAVLQRNFGSPEPGAVRLLQRLGYIVRENLSGDYIMTVMK